MFFRRILCVLLLALAGSAKGQQQVASIVTVVVNSTNHTTLELLVTRADLATDLSAPGETFTLFAPTDDAFSALPDSMLKKKIAADALAPVWKPLLQDILKYHVLPRKYNVTDLPADATDVETISGGVGLGSFSKLSIKNGAPFLTGAGSSKANILPSPNRDFQTLNGVVHAVDGVLLPPSTQRTVVDIAKGNTAMFSTLVELLTLAGLDTTLSKNDDVLTAYTVFAPTNDAFSKIDAETIACLKDPANKDVLANLLKFHVVSGTVVSSALKDGQVITSIATNGFNPYTHTTSPYRKLTAKGESKFNTMDMLGNNGVVHMIDAVLIPTNFACPAAVSSGATLSGSTFAAVVAAGLVVAKVAL